MLFIAPHVLSNTGRVRANSHTCRLSVNLHVDRVHRITMLAVTALCLLLLTPVQRSFAGEPVSTEQSFKSPKLYSPFDEARSRIPSEILSDQRLDTKVTVSARNKNMKDLFLELCKLTGIKIAVSRDLSGERPIVFFHDKPLRDVMTEISALYGYYWLVNGKQGGWEYELFEDVHHSKRRNEVRDSEDAAKTEALLDVIEMVRRTASTEGEAGLARLQRTNPRLYESVADAYHVELIKSVGSMGRETLRNLLNDVGMVSSGAELSTEMQSGLLKSTNLALEEFARKKDQSGGSSTINPWTPEQLRSSIVSIKRWRASVFSAPHITVKMSLPAKGDRAARQFTFIWPKYSEEEPDMPSMPTVPPGKVIGDPLPKDVKITIKQTRVQLYDGAILVGDVLEAIAKQANVNIIADYYFQETPLPACSGESLDKLASEICQKLDYTCQVEKNTLRFRFNKWFLQPLPEEPSKSLQEHWWGKIVNTGGLSLNDLMDIACLPNNQTFWGGFRLIPQARQARLFPRTARLVQMLGSILEAQACTPEGLSVSELNADQFGRIADWAGVMGIKETPEGLLRSMIRIEKSGDPLNSLRFVLVLPDGSPRSVVMTATLKYLKEEDRHTLAAERASEIIADRVKLSVPSGK
jgi:hypothetical protein